MGKKAVLLITFLIFAALLYSQHLNIVSTGDPVLEDIRYVSLESGIPFLSFSPPLSSNEVRNFLNFVDENALSQAGRNAYSRILNAINPKMPPLSWSDEVFSVSFNIKAVLEGKARFNKDITWEGNLANISPLISFPLQFFFSKYVQMYIEPNISVKSRDHGDGLFFYNLPMDFSTQYWPFRSFASAGGSWWNFFIGRDHLYWGTGHTGSLIFSNDSTYYDFAKVSLFSRYFKYSFTLNHMPLKLNKSLIDNFSSIDKDERKSINRYFYLHRIDVNILRKVSISIMEGIMSGNSPLEIRFINPLVIFHSLYAWTDYDRWSFNSSENSENGSMIGSFLSFEINLNIIKSLSVYGQFVMNELSLRGEKEKEPDLPPNGMGYLAGINFSHPINSWGSIYYLEFIYTDPYLYILSSPFCSFIQQDHHNYLIGHSRDTMSLTFGAKFFNNDALNLSGSFSWVASGAHNRVGLKWDWDRGETYNEKTPSGTAENKFILSLGAEWNPLSWLALKAGITGIISLNNKHIDGVREAGGQASLSVGFKY